MVRTPGSLCPDCDGTGFGPCATCGDGHSECACDEQEETECDSCEGTGVCPDEAPAEDRDDEETQRNDEGD